VNIQAGESGPNAINLVVVVTKFVEGEPLDKHGMVVLNAQMSILKKNKCAILRLAPVTLYIHI
jgi:hypothetical protein